MIKKIKKYINNIRKFRLDEIKQQMRWIYLYAKPHFFSICIYTLLGLTGTVVGLFGSLVSRDFVDIITGHKTGELLIAFGCMLMATLMGTFIGQVSSYISAKISMRIDNSIKYDVFSKIIETEWEELNKYHSADLQVRWNVDSSTISSGILTILPNFIIDLFKFISALYMVCRYDASFAVFALISAPLSLVISRESLKRMQKNNMSSLSMNSQISGFNQEAFGNMQTIKAFDLIPTYKQRLLLLQKEYTNTRLKYQKASNINAIVLMVLSMCVSFMAQGWGIYKVWRGDISYGTMTMFISLSSTLSITVDNMVNLFPRTIGLKNSVKRIRSITDLPKENFERKEEIKLFYEKNRQDGIGVHIRDIVYAYRDSEFNVFDGVNFDAFPREMVALVGPSGEGKTTMLRYLLALIHSTSGKGYICAGNTLPEDGDFYELSAASRQLIAYVPQGNTMFTGTIADNMRNVKEDATDEEIIEALKKACAWSFIERLPEGIYSKIHERGGGFSEGQAQRISIARALLKKAPILLLDEATSALDIVTEKELLRNIMEDKYARTCIVTTHRPTVLNICNRVYSMEEKKCRILDKSEVKELIEEF